MTPARALIVDDEPLARERIRTLLARDPRITVAGEATDGIEAINAIRALNPDLLFLDIQMPHLDGFGVIHALGADRLPAVIFITAYDEYALKAFDIHAVDYLLKPYDPDRFAEAVERALRRLAAPTPPATPLPRLLDDLRRDHRVEDRLLVGENDRIIVLKAADIDYVESAGNYVKIHVGRKEHLLRETMKSLEKRLPPHFVRIHRTYIVNTERIKELHPYFHGDYVLMLADATRLPLSRRYRPRLEAALGKTP